jgi:hypothetical protein
MQRKPAITRCCGQHHRIVYSGRNGKVHTRLSAAQMTMCVHSGTPRWRYGSRQDLGEKCAQFPLREAKLA